MNKLSFLFMLLLSTGAVMYACNGKGSTGHAIKGNIVGAGNLQVTLDQAHFDRTNISIGKTTCNADGLFEIKSDKPFEEGLYRLKIGAKQMFFILDGKEEVVEIIGNLETIDRMEIQVKGSETLSCYTKIIQDMLKGQMNGTDQVRATIQRGCTPLMQAFLTTQLLGQAADKFMDDFRAQSTALATAMPGSKYASDYANMVARLEKQMEQQKMQGGEEIIKVGMDAPDIKLPDPNGKIRSLSALKGKVVLLDFWASWCRPCRNENPHVVELYNKYKSRGFEVFSVSLDRPDGKNNWIDAIKADGLIWENHVSDLKFWDCAPAATYGVRSIPKTFLIGKDGKVAAINARMDLEQEILKVL